MPKKAKELTALTVSKIKSEGRYAVGGADGLHFCVVGNSRCWTLRIAVGMRTNSKGKTVVHRRDMGLGSYPEVSLAEARDKAREMRKQVKNGIDPLELKKRNRDVLLIQQRQAKTFRECAEVVIENKSHELSGKQGAFWRSSIERYVFPALGDRIVGTITHAEVAAALDPIWQTKYKTAKELRGRIETIFDYAKAMEYREGDNPAAWKGVLEPILGRVKRQEKPHSALPYAEIGAFMRDLRKHEGTPARALELIILTATRAGETFAAKWREFDMESRIWTIPADRMKMKKEHRVPLSDEAVKLLESMSRNSDAQLVFQTPRGGIVTSNSVSLLIKDMHESAIKAGGKGYIDPKQDEIVSTHGFRSTFRDWAGETTAYTREVCEHALAHKLADKIEAAYQRGDMLAKRARMMTDWARYCGTIRQSADNNAVSIEEIEE